MKLGCAALVLDKAALLPLGLAGYGRMLLGARGELQRAEQRAAAGDAQATCLHLRRALAYYAPGNPWAHRAAAALEGR